MHERPPGKIRIIPTVGLFRCFYVNSKKNGWMSFSKRSDNAPVCYTKPLDSLKNWNNQFFWVDDFACPALFPWHTAKYLTRDPAPVADDFNAHDYATLVAHPSSFWKFPKEFLCLVGLSRHYTLDEETYPWFLHKIREKMDIFAFIHTPDPTKVKVVERERIKDEPLLLVTTVGRMVPLLPVAPDRAESELEASVDRIFDEGGIDVAPVQLKCQRKRKTVVVNASEPSHHPPKRGEAIPTLPFVTCSVSATPESEGRDHTDSVVGPNLRTISAPQKFVISLDSSHHSSANVAEAEVDSLVRSFVPVMTVVTTVTSTVDPALVVKEKPVKSSLFSADSSSAGGADPNTGVF
ncbi:hypothetical protein Tco_1230253 [Tanacetum coccineum]